jgi:cellulose biosynthesis protein BcsQ
VIVTFYSYKGGVGRSMALANVADLLARSGLEVLLVDFDLEAPGLEHFFPIDHDAIRGREGLLDLLLSFKQSMSVTSGSAERRAFRQLDRFIASVYPPRDGCGRLDLLPAGRRLTDEQMGSYGAELRQFDWVDFYFSWSGELFFEWLRRTVVQQYDAVLVDSRTGLTEIGGVCGYQLPDTIVMLCAPNLQNVEGTEAMARHFLSPQVRAVRNDRPLNVLIVPARVDQEDTESRRGFEERFTARFAEYLPPDLAAADLSLWDLQIPYEPRFAYDERVITDPTRSDERRGLAGAYGTLLEGIALLAPDDSRLAELRPPLRSNGELGRAKPVETRFDPTTRYAAPDVFISFGVGSEEAAGHLRELLDSEGRVVATSADPRAPDASYTRAFSQLVQAASVGIVLVSRHGDRSPWREREIRQLLSSSRRAVLPVLLPGASPDQVPPALQDYAYLALREVVDWDSLVASVDAALTNLRSVPPPTGVAPDPYRGLVPFREEDSDFFFGREAEVDAILDRLRQDGTCSVVGTAGIGKTSVVFAGLVPTLRRGRLPGSEHWPVVRLRPGNRPLVSLKKALATLVGPPQGVDDDVIVDIDALGARIVDLFQLVLLVVDQMEELFIAVDADEREAFVDALDQLYQGGRGAVAPILVVRSEVFHEAIQMPALARLLSNPIILGTLSRERLRAAVEVPAQRLGVAFEPGLVDRLLADVGDEPGAIALLQFVLRELWQHQRDGYLTHQSYDGMGGAIQGLVSRADAALQSLSAHEREIAREVFLTLVGIGEVGARRRTTVAMEELIAGLEERGFTTAESQRMVEWLQNYWLLVTTVARGRLLVAISHEALIGAWPTLQVWIEEAQGALRARSQLEFAARDWVSLDGDNAALLTPERVTQLLGVIGDTPLSATEREFVSASQRHARAQGRRQKLVFARWSAAATATGATLLVVVSQGFGGSNVSIALILSTAGAALVSLTMAFGRRGRSGSRGDGGPLGRFQ